MCHKRPAPTLETGGHLKPDHLVALLQNLHLDVLGTTGQIELVAIRGSDPLALCANGVTCFRRKRIDAGDLRVRRRRCGRKHQQSDESNGWNGKLHGHPPVCVSQGEQTLLPSVHRRKGLRRRGSAQMHTRGELAVPKKANYQTVSTAFRESLMESQPSRPLGERSSGLERARS